MIDVESYTGKAGWQVQGLLRADSVNSFPLFWGLRFVRMPLAVDIAGESQW